MMIPPVHAKISKIMYQIRDIIFNSGHKVVSLMPQALII